MYSPGTRIRTVTRARENNTRTKDLMPGTRTGTVIQRIIPYRTDEHSLGTRIRTVTRASEITRVPIYGPIRVA